MEIGGRFPLRPRMRSCPLGPCSPDLGISESLTLPGLAGFRSSWRSFSASTDAQVSFRVRKNAQDGLGGAQLGAASQMGVNVAIGANVAVTEPNDLCPHALRPEPHSRETAPKQSAEPGHEQLRVW